MPTLSDALKSLRKEMAHAFELDDSITGLSTGSLAVDIITGIGGFPRGRVSEVFGWETSGKTTLCLMSCAAAQRRGEFPVYIDIEHGVDRNLAAHIGFDVTDPSKGLLLQPNTFEESVKLIDTFASTGEVHLIVGDSVPGMVPQSLIEGKIEEVGRIGEMARLLSSTLPRLTKTVADSGTALVFCNQMRKKVNTGWTPPGAPTEETAGGSALRFYSSLRIEMKVVKKGETKIDIKDIFTGKDISVPISNTHEAHAFKNKVSSPYRRGTFTIRFDAVRDVWGIDQRQTFIDIGTTQGLITKKTGGRYSFFDPTVTLPVGEEALYDFFLANPDAFAKLSDAVLNLDVVKNSLRR